MLDLGYKRLTQLSKGLGSLDGITDFLAQDHWPLSAALSPGLFP